MRNKDPEKREAIFNAALKFILEEGFSGMKMSAVAKRAGVATGTLYIYFSNKSDLINELYRDLKKKSAAEYIEGYQDTMGFAEGFEVIWFNYLERNLKKPEEGAFLEQYYRSPYLNEETKEESDRLLQPIFDLIEKGKKERVVKNVSTPLLVAQLSGALNEIVKWHMNGSLELNKKTIAAAYELAWQSIVR